MVNLLLARKRVTHDTTLGELMIPGRGRPLYTCEDLVREPQGFTARRDAAWVQSWKVPGKTAIPSGRYRLAWTWSNRFKRPMLLLVDVPGFAGIRIHALNRSTESEGCIGPGMDLEANGVGSSRAAVSLLEGLLVGPHGLHDPETWIEVRNDFWLDKEVPNA